LSRGGIVMMVVILTLVWGGFVGVLAVAMARERQGRRERAGQKDGTMTEPGGQAPPDQGGD